MGVQIKTKGIHFKIREAQIKMKGVGTNSNRFDVCPKWICSRDKPQFTYRIYLRQAQFVTFPLLGKSKQWKIFGWYSRFGKRVDQEIQEVPFQRQFGRSAYNFGGNVTFWSFMTLQMPLDKLWNCFNRSKWYTSTRLAGEYGVKIFAVYGYSRLW